MENIFADNLSKEQQEALAPLFDAIDQIMALDDNTLNEQTVEIIRGAVTGAFTDNIKNASIKAVIENMRQQDMTRREAQTLYQGINQSFNELIDELKPSEYKRSLLISVFEPILQIFDAALEQFKIFDIILPMTVAKSAYEPTYAHESDACADIYSVETVVVPANSLGNKIHTGICIELPEGWQAKIAPRSSIGAKTPLRLSNNIAIIDPDYRGELIVLYDNISNEDYTINAGDRIAQMWVEPVYRFKAKVVESLNETERNDGGLGSTGK